MHDSTRQAASARFSQAPPHRDPERPRADADPGRRKSALRVQEAAVTSDVACPCFIHRHRSPHLLSPTPSTRAYLPPTAFALIAIVTVASPIEPPSLTPPPLCSTMAGTAPLSSRPSRRVASSPRPASAVVVPPPFHWAPVRSPTAAAGATRDVGRMLSGSMVARASPIAAALAAASLRCPEGVFGIVAPLAIGGLLFVHGVKQFQAKMVLDQA